jgi:hypothetical protein
MRSGIAKLGDATRFEVIALPADAWAVGFGNCVEPPQPASIAVAAQTRKA